MRLKRLYTYLLTLLICTLGLHSAAQIGLVNNAIIYSTEEINSFSDTSALFSVKEIIIEGNKKTENKTILRELSFSKGEQYPLNELVAKFAQAKRRLLNTTLFHTVVVSLKSIQGYEASVNITVHERWYIYPVPFIKVIDNSLQNWIKNEGMDLKRVNYGVKVTHKNFSGKNDKLTMNITNGYTKRLYFRYEGFQLDRELKWSTGFSTALGQNRDVAYTTVNNMAVSYKNPSQYVHSFFNVSGDITYRPAIKSKHTFGIGYNREKILDTVSKISSLFPPGKNQISFPEVFYKFQYFDADFIPYPTKGYVGEFLLEKKGFGGAIDLLQATVRTSASWRVSKKYYFHWRTTGIIKLPFDQPYKMQGFIGSNGMYIQGYEDYIINGVAGGFTKLTFAREFLNRSYSISSQKVKRLNHIPVKIYGKVFGNTGYVYNKEKDFSNTLSNRFLYSGGLGLDIILFYDFTIKLEWSVNHLRQNGIYLHDRSYL